MVVMDNLQNHKVAGVRQAIAAAGASVVYLPPYSPDFNSIEQVFAKVKAILKEKCGTHGGRIAVPFGPGARRIPRRGVPRLLPSLRLCRYTSVKNALGFPTGGAGASSAARRKLRFGRGSRFHGSSSLNCGPLRHGPELLRGISPGLGFWSLHRRQ